MNDRNNTLDWFMLVMRRDLILSFRRSATYLTPLIFFLIVVTFFPLALGPSQSLLSSLAAGIIWISALLSSLLAVEGVFSEDYQDGTMDQYFISREPVFVLIFAKVLCHWLVCGAPIILASIISSLFLYLPSGVLFALIESLLMGTFFMSLLGALGAALSLGRSAILSAIIVLPFSIPTLLMGTAIMTAAINQQDYSGFLSIMGAMLAIGILSNLVDL